jgi:thiol-disulfide isomerase/thioredoxin
MKRTVLISMSLIVAAFTGCGHGGRHEPLNKVVFHLNGAFNRHFLIERTGLNDEDPSPIDSGIGASNRDTFVYDLPPSEARVYMIRFQGKSFQLPFIDDSTGLDIFYNYTTGQYHFEHSPASEEWQRFRQGQEGLDMRTAYTRNFNFADTVTNPALFLMAYNMVEYGNDYDGLQHFMQRAAQRFPTHQGVQTLVRNTLDYISIFRSPLHVGDSLPALSLPDPSGQAIAIRPIPGKYLLIDFWSTWCDDCRLFSDAKKESWKKMDTSRFSIISVAIDAEKATWQKVIAGEQYPWQQLIDEKMWTGPTARAYKFDSLPYNFLVDPHGIIVAKAIPADSLLQRIKAISARP